MLVRKIGIIICLIVIQSCKHDLERPNWDVDLLIPIINTEMNINSMLTDSGLIATDNDEGYISLLFQEEFLDMNLDSLIKVDAIADEKTHTLDSASFADVNIIDSLTVVEILGFDPSGLPPLQTPAQNISNDTIIIDASEYFENMLLHTGWLKINITNNLPVDITNINMVLFNSTNQTSIANFNFSNIPSGMFVKDSVDISNKLLDENIVAKINNIDILASNGPVSLNANNAIITNVSITDIGITEATAIFPEQQLTENLKEHTFSLGNTQIKELGIKSGTVTVFALSTLPNGKMIYNIPSLKKNGIPFTSGPMYIPKATNSTLSSFEYNFEGYTLDLTGEENRIGGDTVNTIYTEAYTFIDSTGELVTLNQADSFYSYIDFNLTPEYAIGYLGKDTIYYGPEKKEISIFNKISADILNLESADINLNIENTMGVDALISINKLSTSNGTETVNSNINPNQSYFINRAELTNNNLPIISNKTTISIDADEMLEILPNEINSEATLITNPNGPHISEGFLYPEYPMYASLDVEIPMSLIAKNLTLIDTVDVNIQNNNDIEKIYIRLQNGFPLNASINLITLDQENLMIDTLISTNILAASTNNLGIVNNSTSTNMEFNYPEILNVKKIIIISSFSTASINEYLKIYSDYNLKTIISAKVNKTINN